MKFSLLTVILMAWLANIIRYQHVVVKNFRYRKLLCEYGVTRKTCSVGVTSIGACLTALLFCLLLPAAQRLHAQNFSDMFADSQTIYDSSITILDSNTNATLEPGEPHIAGKIGGHSVWIAWQPQENGVVTMSTASSSFDTLLGVYTLENNDSPGVQNLESVAANDDFGGELTSEVQFGVNANQTYYISVDGFNGATGDIVFSLNLLSYADLQPTVLSNAGDRALRLGDPLILTVNFIPVAGKVDFQWYFDGNLVNDATQPTLVIPNLQQTNLGFYSLEFELNDDTFSSSPIEIQVNSEGQQYALARSKIADAAQSGLNPVASGNVNIGYNGTQIYNTTNAVIDPAAPLICGVPPGAAYWFSYTAPATGLLSVDTGGSAIPTLLAAFTYTNQLLNYSNLVQLACDNNSDGTGTNTTSFIQFEVTNGENYFIVASGVNGARGVIHINYSLAAGVPPSPPVVSSQPQSLTVGAGTAVALSVTAAGTAPVAYQWWKNNAKIRSATNPTLLLSKPAAADAGTYFVVVTNYSGSVTSTPAQVSVLSNPQVITYPGSLVSIFPGVRGYQYTADSSSDLGSWNQFSSLFPDYGGILWVTNSTTNNNLFVRVHTP